MSEERITELEIRLEYQDRLIGTLNDVLTAQQAQIDGLEADLRKIHQKLEGDELSIGPAGERPPHY